MHNRGGHSRPHSDRRRPSEPFDTLTLTTSTPGLYELYAFPSENGRRRRPMHIRCTFMGEPEDRADSEEPEQPPSSSTGPAHAPPSETHAAGQPPPSTTKSAPHPRSHPSTHSPDEQGGRSREGSVSPSDHDVQRSSGPVDKPQDIPAELHPSDPIEHPSLGLPSDEGSTHNGAPTSARASTPLSRAANPGRGLFPVTPIRRPGECSSPLVPSSSPYVASGEGSSSSADNSPTISHVSETQDEYGPELQRPPSPLPSESARARAQRTTPQTPLNSLPHTPEPRVKRRRASTPSPPPLAKQRKTEDGPSSQPLHDGVRSAMGEETQLRICEMCGSGRLRGMTDSQFYIPESVLEALATSL
ncbi:hypothetical protein BV25DRAFT_497897 [Artomyces pyxidatus]|uniref:Uncharacterized protein n=1 Tax=Artomyces pyxidatus TaxID=48021 RepID=A0ACB8SDS1_9AGAM|nr:hypothetical protein BV25DRAFT_497897 [Artomyces pyxidatus]